MACDLWSSSYDQGVHDVNYRKYPGCQCDLYFCCGPDVIEEDALNEESCVQVLRILITKANTEIEKLEKDLSSLQNDLALAENEKWPELCCSALNENINWLDDALSALKSDHTNDTKMQLQLHNNPAETLQEIVRALQQDHCQDSDSQNLDANILNSSLNVTEHALDNEASNINSNILIKVEGNELCGTSEDSRVSRLLLELKEKRSDDPKMIEKLLAKFLPRSPDLWAISWTPCHSDGIKLLGTSDLKVAGKEEVRRSQLIPTVTGQISTLFPSKGKGNIPRESKQENAIVKIEDVRADAFRVATGIEGRRRCLDSKIGASKRGNSGNSDLDKKLCDFVPRAFKKESYLAPAEDLDFMNLPLQVVYPQELCCADTEICSSKGNNGENSKRVMNIQNACLICAENSAYSVLEMQTKIATYTGSQLTDEERPQAQGLKSAIAASLRRSNMGFHSKNGKRKLEVEAFSARELHGCSIEVISNASLIVTSKKQRKSRASTDRASLSESMNKMITRRAVQRALDETEECAIVLYDSKFSELQTKRRVSRLPISMGIENSTVDLNMVAMDNGRQVDLQICESYSLVDSHNESSTLLSIHLKSLKVTALRAIAKQLNVRKYYKLPKGDLVKQLVDLGKGDLVMKLVDRFS